MNEKRRVMRIESAFFVIAVTVVVFAFFCLFASCNSHKDKTATAPIVSPEDLNRADYVLGVPQGTAAMMATEQKFEKPKILYYNSLAEGYTAVRHKKIDAFIFDRHNLEYAIKADKDMALLPEDIAEVHIAVGLSLRHEELLREVDRFIAQYREDGTYADMYARWFSGEPPPMPDIPVPKNPTRRLKVGTEGQNEPMNFYGKDGALTGFDLEFSRRLALFLNVEIDIQAMPFDGLIPAVEGGKLDMLIANLNKTPERARRMLFSADYVDSAVCAMVRKDRLKKNERNFKSVRQLDDSKYVVGGETGTVSLRTAEESLPNARFRQFSYPVDMYLALESKKIDAVVYDRAALDYAAANRKSLTVLPDEIGIGHIAVAAPFRNRNLVEKVNEFIKTYRADGTYDNMYQRWILTKHPRMPEIPEPEVATETIVVGTDCQNEPMNFLVEGGQLAGFDIEFIKRLALFLNVKIEIKLISYEALFVAAAAGKIDLAVASLDATEERKESMLFTDDYIDNPIAVMIRKEDFASAESAVDDVSQLYEKRIGVMAGTTYDEQVAKQLPSSVPVYFNSVNDMVLALEVKKVDAFVMDEPQFPMLSRERPTIKRLPRNLDHCDYAFLFSKSKKELCDAFSEQIRAMKHDGTLKKLEEKWFHGPESEQIMTPQPTDPPNGVLRYATVPQFIPMSFIRDGKVVGFDVECVESAAARLGYRAEPVVMEWNACLEAAFSGKVDFAVGTIAVTEERKQKALFSEPNLHGGTIVVVRKDETTGAAPVGPVHRLQRFGKNIAESFDRTFIREGRWKLLASGLKITVLITLQAAFFGTLLAFLVCALRRSKSRTFRWIAQIFIAVMQGTPMLVIMMLLYYVAFARIDIDAVYVAVIGFSMNFAVNIGELMRSVLDGIPRGQYEAGMALGFNRFAAFRKIIFPQMLRRMLPVYRGELVTMLKLTAIVGYIAIQDLTKMSDIIRSRTYEAFFPLIVTAVIYFTVARLMASVLTFIEYRLDPKKRRRAI